MPTDLRKDSIIFLEVNPQALFSDNFELFGSWPEKLSIIDKYKAIDDHKELSDKEIYLILKYCFDTDENISIRNILSRSFCSSDTKC